MACCGSSINNKNLTEILKALRNKDEKIFLKLNNLKLEFVQKEAKWNSNSIN